MSVHKKGLMINKTFPKSRKDENVTVKQGRFIQKNVSEEHKERLKSLDYLVLRNSNFSIFYAHVIF